MQVRFKSQDPEAAALRPDVEQRVRFVLRRFSWRVSRASVQFTDLNGPRGGIDKQCRVELQADGADPVVVSSVARDWRRALNDALARASRAILRLWQQGRAGRRLRQPALALAAAAEPLEPRG